MMRTLLILIAALTGQTAAGENKKPLEIKKIEPNVYLHTSFKHVEGYGMLDSNGLIVVDGKQAYIIDTPWSEDDAQSLLSWIKEKGYTAKASVSTHSHEDRTAGIRLFNANSVPTYTSELTKHLLVKEGKPIPTHTFDNSEFILADGLVELYYPGAGHAQDNIVAWLPKSKILFGGCLVRSHEWDSLGYVGDASVDSWAASIKNIQSRKYDIHFVVPGHGNVGHAEILEHTIDLAEAASERMK